MRKLVLTTLILVITSTSVCFSANNRLANANKRGVRARSLEQVLRMSPEDVDLATAALIISERWSDVVPGRTHLVTLDEMAREIRRRLDRARLKANFQAIPVINEYLFKELGFKPVDEADDPNDLFLHSVLDKKQGYCLSLSVLYLSIGERLGLPLYGVVVPGHFFVRYDDTRIRFNIETVGNGGSPPDDYYLRKYNVPQGQSDSIYMKNLNAIQTLGCFFNNLGIVYSEVGNNKSSLETLQLAIAINPTLSESHSSLGNAYLRNDQITEAISAYQKALQINPDNAKTHNNLGNAYMERTWYNYAVEQYIHALKLDPTLLDAHKNLARTYSVQKRYAEAIARLTLLRHIAPNDPECYSQMGTVYVQMEKYDQAIDYYQRAIAIDPNRIVAYCGLAHCYNKLGDVRKEIEAYQKTLAIDPFMLTALINLGNTCFQQKQYNAAIEYYAKAAMVQHQDAAIYYNIGAAFSNMDQYEQALEPYLEAVRIDPKFADAHYGLAVSYYHLKKYELAWKYINSAKKLGAKVTQKQIDSLKSKLK